MIALQEKKLQVPQQRNAIIIKDQTSKIPCQRIVKGVNHVIQTLCKFLLKTEKKPEKQQELQLHC